MENLDEESPYQAIEDQWSQGGESHALSDEEADYVALSWPGDEYSSPNVEGDYDYESWREDAEFERGPWYGDAYSKSDEEEEQNPYEDISEGGFGEE